MSSEYEKKLEKYKDAKKKLLRAEKSLTVAKAGLSEFRDTPRELHSKLTDEMAKLDAGEAEKQDVSEARRAWEESKSELEERKTQVKAKEKAVPIFREKMNDAKTEFKEAAYDVYQEKASDIIQQFSEAFALLQKAENAQNELWEEMKKQDLDPALFMPQQIDSFDIKLNHLRRPYSPEKWLELAEEKNDNFTINNNN